MGILSALKGLLRDGGLVICTPETGEPILKSTIQLDGDVVNVVTHAALGDEAARNAHVRRIDAAMASLRRLRSGLNAPVYLLGGVVTIHSALVWVDDWRAMVGGALAPYLTSALLILVRPAAVWVVRKLVGI